MSDRRIEHTGQNNKSKSLHTEIVSPQFCDNLVLSMDIDTNVDGYTKKYDSDARCNFCGGECKKLYNTYLYDAKIITKSCYLCHIICNFSSSHIGQAFLVFSKLSQQKINEKILDYYYKHNIILTPSKLDKDCKVVNLSLFKFATFDIEVKKKFPNFKIMFSPIVQNYLNNTEKANMFVCSNQKNNECIEKYSFKHIDVNEYELTTEDKKNLKSIENKYDPEILKIKESLKLKLQKIILKDKIISELC